MATDGDDRPSRGGQRPLPVSITVIVVLRGARHGGMCVDEAFTPSVVLAEEEDWARDGCERAVMGISASRILSRTQPRNDVDSFIPRYHDRLRKKTQLVKRCRSRGPGSHHLVTAAVQMTFKRGIVRSPYINISRLVGNNPSRKADSTISKTLQRHDQSNKIPPTRCG